MSKIGMLAIAGTVALAGTSAADAAVVVHNYNVGLPGSKFFLTSGTPTSPTITAIFSDVFSGSETNKDFITTYSFTIPQTGLGSGSISTSFSSKNLKLVITDLIINGIDFTVPFTGGGYGLSVADIPIAANELNTIVVKGHSAKKANGFTGTLTFEAAVPETATWGMMLAGFGLVGMAMRRRRTSLTFA